MSATGHQRRRRAVRAAEIVDDLRAFSVSGILAYVSAVVIQLPDGGLGSKEEILATIYEWLQSRLDPPGVEVIEDSYPSKDDEAPPWEPDKLETPAPSAETTVAEEVTKPGEPGPDLLTKEDVETLPWSSLRKAANERGVRGKTKDQLLENLRAAGHPV